jgi:hypothetical protein
MLKGRVYKEYPSQLQLTRQDLPTKYLLNGSAYGPAGPDL